MSLVKWNKSNDFFPSIFGDIFNEDLFERISTKVSVPAVNLKENEKSFEIHMAAPGLNKEDFKIKVDNNILTISNESKSEKEEEEQGKFTRREYAYNKFERSFTLPESADIERIEAKYENGELKLNLPKKEDKIDKVREINIL